MTKSALYRFYGASDVLLYVGISQCPFTRAKAHDASDQCEDGRFGPETCDLTIKCERCRYILLLQSDRPF
jgi:hypothetical protein